MNLTPRQVYRWSLRVLYASAPVTVLVVLAWAFHLLPAARPVLAMMLYTTALGITLGAALTTVAASCHLAIGRAFSAGMRAGAEHVDGQVQRALRLVE